MQIIRTFRAPLGQLMNNNLEIPYIADETVDNRRLGIRREEPHPLPVGKAQ